ADLHSRVERRRWHDSFDVPDVLHAATGPQQLVGSAHPNRIGHSIDGADIAGCRCRSACLQPESGSLTDGVHRDPIVLSDHDAGLVDNGSRPHSVAEAFFQQRSITAVSHETDFLALDRKSTRLNSSHVEISYAVFCLK